VTRDRSISAGGDRNQQIIDDGKLDGVVAFPGGTGTADMIRRAKKAGLEVWKPYPHLTDLWRRR